MWYAVNYATNTILADVFGKLNVFLVLPASILTTIGIHTCSHAPKSINIELKLFKVVETIIV